MKAGWPEPLLAERAESPCQAAPVVTTEASKRVRFLEPGAMKLKRLSIAALVAREVRY